MNASDHFIDSFRIGKARATLTQNYDDDSRSVFNEDGKCVLKFDSSLGVHQDGKLIGRLSSSTDKWRFVPNIDSLGEFVTSQPIRDYHWVNIQCAEIEVAQHLLM